MSVTAHQPKFIQAKFDFEGQNIVFRICPQTAPTNGHLVLFFDTYTQHLWNSARTGG